MYVLIKTTASPYFLSWCEGTPSLSLVGAYLIICIYFPDFVKSFISIIIVDYL